MLNINTLTRWTRSALALTTFLALAVFCSSASANLLVNPGFEDPITYDGPPLAGFWEGFSGEPSGAFNSTSMPRTGSQSLELIIDGVSNTFAGVFQDVEGLSAGQSVSYSGWHKSLGDAGGIEIRIEWRDLVSDVEIARTANLVPFPAPDASYSQFTLDAVVPTGADLARVVYAIQSFGAGPNQQVFVDDTSFVTSAVPEPATLALFGLGLAGLGFARRRKA